MVRKDQFEALDWFGEYLNLIDKISLNKWTIYWHRHFMLALGPLNIGFDISFGPRVIDNGVSEKLLVENLKYLKFKIAWS